MDVVGGGGVVAEDVGGVGEGEVCVRRVGGLGFGEEGWRGRGEGGWARTGHFVVHDDACFGHHYSGAEEEVDSGG